MAIHLVKGVAAKVIISRVDHSEGDGCATVDLYQGEAILMSAATIVKLTKPILIRHGVKHEIRIDLPISRDFSSFAALKSEVRLRSNITVKFHHDTVKDGQKSGLINELGFSYLY